jgi:DNA-binding CsgD family transcriptional regulator
VPELREQWGFTLAEAQLAQQLMRGCSLEEAAQRVSVSKNTVRSQLRSLFMKTETHRQAELVRVLLTLSHA